MELNKIILVAVIISSVLIYSAYSAPLEIQLKVRGYQTFT